MPCGREINDPPSPVLLHLAAPPPPSPSVGRPELQSPVCMELTPPSSSATLPRSPSLPPPSSSTSAFLFLYLCPPRTALSPASLPRSFCTTPSATPYLLDQRPGDGTTRKAGFKIIMARAILITVARTTTISGWHHHYKSVVRGAATPPTTTAAYASPPYPFDISLHVSPFMRAIDVRSELCKDTVAPKYI